MPPSSPSKFTFLPPDMRRSASAPLRGSTSGSRCPTCGGCLQWGRAVNAGLVGEKLHRLFRRYMTSHAHEKRKVHTAVWTREKWKMRKYFANPATRQPVGRGAGQTRKRREAPAALWGEGDVADVANVTTAAVYTTWCRVVTILYMQQIRFCFQKTVDPNELCFVYFKESGTNDMPSFTNTVNFLRMTVNHSFSAKMPS